MVTQESKPKKRASPSTPKDAAPTDDDRGGARLAREFFAALVADPDSADLVSALDESDSRGDLVAFAEELQPLLATAIAGKRQSRTAADPIEEALNRMSILFEALTDHSARLVDEFTDPGYCDVAMFPGLIPEKGNVLLDAIFAARKSGKGAK